MIRLKNSIMFKSLSFNENTTWKNFARTFFALVTVIQTVLAIGWIAGNVSAYRASVISDNYISAAETYVVDDYMGILYALIIRALGHSTLLYFFQLLLCFISMWVLLGFLKKNGDTRVDILRRVLLTVFFVTCAPVLDACFYVRPEAVALASLLLMSSFLIGYYRDNKSYMLPLAIIMFAVLGILKPDYVYVAFVVLLPFAVCLAVKKRKLAIPEIVCYIGIALLCFLLNKTLCTSGAYSRATRTPGLIFTECVAADTIDKSEWVMAYNGLDFSTEFSEAIGSPECFNSVLMHKFEENYSSEQMKELYGIFISDAFKRKPGVIVKTLVRNMSGYLLPGLMAPTEYLKRSENVILATRLDNFVLNNSKWAVTYITFGYSANLLLVLLGFIEIGLKLKFDVRSKSLNYCFAAVIYIMLVTALYATVFTAGGFDYLNSLFNASVPVLGLSVLTIRKTADIKRQKQQIKAEKLNRE